jgi:prepilin-type processing-associated H-X9-DG protein
VESGSGIRRTVVLLSEYKHYCDPPPWGTLPQNYNVTTYPTHEQHLRAYKGYLFWPQTRSLVTAAEFASFPVTWNRYAPGYPATANLYSDMAPGRSMSLDCSPHTVKGSGFNANVLYGDGHVGQNLWPQNPATGKYYFPSPLDAYHCDLITNLDPPYNDATLWWDAISVCEYVMKYQP